MAESKKGVKQATISAFFSPTKAGHESSHSHAAASELNRVHVKRPRVSSRGGLLATTLETSSRDDRVELNVKDHVGLEDEANEIVTATDTTKVMVKATQKKKKKKQRLVRFTSPHAVSADDDEEECFDDDDDVFCTPEAKRARAELETGAGAIAAGASILDDDIVDEESIVDVDEESIVDVDADDSVVTAANIKAVNESATSDVDASIVVLEVDDAARNATAGINDDDKKARKNEAANTSAGVKSKNAVVTSMTKRQVGVKQLATDATEIKHVRVEPLDPIIQARVDTYKMKTDELIRVYRELSLSEQESDAIMQDIYGVKLDYDLDVIVDENKVQRALMETWQKLQDYARSIPDSADVVVLPTTVPFPYEVKSFIVKAIQGRSASLSVVSQGLVAAFKEDVKVLNYNVEESETKSGPDVRTVDRAASLAMEMEIKTLAQRIPHGVRPAKANVFEDTTVDALWVWEVGSLETYFGDEAQKTVKRMRKHRKRLGQQLKTLARVTQLLHQKPVDEAKVSAEEAKVGKFGFIVAAELQKAKDKETKVLEKRAAAEEKKQLDKRRLLERQEAKDEEKRKRDRDVEEKELGSSKAQKKFKSFFATDAANSTGTCDSTTDVAVDHGAKKIVHPVESKSTTIARMDAAVSFLGSALTDKPDTSIRSSVSSLKSRRGTRSTAELTLSLSWSSRRHRDRKRGMMKLLQFYENNRPAYYGTFSPRTRVFRGGRRPFAQYSKFDYTIDSDDEWEEEEPGESLSDDENDGDESDEDTLDYNDKWLAYEDEVDYLDDADNEADPLNGGASASPTKHKLPSQLEKKRRAVRSAKLEPQVLGPFWYAHGDDDSTEGHFPELLGELLCQPVFESSLMQTAREHEEMHKQMEAKHQEQQHEHERQGQEKLQDQQHKHNYEKETGTATATVAKQAAPMETQHENAGLQQTLASKKAHAIKALASAEPAPAAVCLRASPAKAPNQINAWFKKVATRIPTAATATLPKSRDPLLPHCTDESKLQDESNASIDVIHVDCE